MVKVYQWDEKTPLKVDFVIFSLMAVMSND